ncbi:hypothetical protein IOD13_04100 [Brevibacterium casei]|nr:hypothetical protein [Brevibacterium casei]
MITERLALAIEALDSGQGSTREVEVVVDGERTQAERMTALVRLGIDPTDSVRVIVSDDELGPESRWTAPTATPSGILHTTLEVSRGGERTAGRATEVGTEAGPTSAPGFPFIRGRTVTGRHRHMGACRPRTGVVEGRARCAPPPRRGPEHILDATDLGGMLLLARAYDPTDPHPDVIALTELDDLTAEILRTLVDAESIRARRRRSACTIRPCRPGTRASPRASATTRGRRRGGCGTCARNSSAASAGERLIRA